MTMNMTLPALLSLAFAAALTAAVPSAASTFEENGYALCARTADQRLEDIRRAPTYFVDKLADARSYFINATTVEDGARVAVRLECRTTINGHKLLAFSVTEGRYVSADDGGDRMSVASN
jgi:hypothetical protein